MNIDFIKGGIISSVSAFLVFVEPIANVLTAMSIIFFANIVMGILADIVHGKEFEFKKIIYALYTAVLFLALTTFIFTIGNLIKNMSGALQLITYLFYVLMWFYGVNIFRNMKQTMKEGTSPYHVVSFIYDVLSLEFVKSVPFLQEYIKKQNNTNTNNSLANGNNG